MINKLCQLGDIGNLSVKCFSASCLPCFGNSWLEHYLSQTSRVFETCVQSCLLLQGFLRGGAMCINWLEKLFSSYICYGPAKKF